MNQSIVFIQKGQTAHPNPYIPQRISNVNTAQIHSSTGRFTTVYSTVVVLPQTLYVPSVKRLRSTGMKDGLLIQNLLTLRCFLNDFSIEQIQAVRCLQKFLIESFPFTEISNSIWAGPWPIPISHRGFAS